MGHDESNNRHYLAGGGGLVDHFNLYVKRKGFILHLLFQNFAFFHRYDLPLGRGQVVWLDLNNGVDGHNKWLKLTSL